MPVPVLHLVTAWNPVLLFSSFLLPVFSGLPVAFPAPACACSAHYLSLNAFHSPVFVSVRLCCAFLLPVFFVQLFQDQPLCFLTVVLSVKTPVLFCGLPLIFLRYHFFPVAESLNGFQNQMKCF